MFRSYIEGWLEHTEVEKASILDTDRDITMKQFGYNNLTKKRYISHVLADSLGTNNLELFKELSIKAIKMLGNPVDEYYINSVLVNYYKKLDDKSTAIKICIETFNNINLYLPELKTEQLKLNNILKDVVLKEEVGTLPDYIFCRDELTSLLISSNKFADAEKFEVLFNDAGLYPDTKDKKKATYNKLYRLVNSIDVSLLHNEINKAIADCEIIATIEKEQAGFGYKKIGNYFLKKENNKEAFDFLKKAFELNPRIDGVDSRLNTLSKKLQIEHKTNNVLIIEELIKKEKSSPRWFELRSVANRYLSIQEFDEAIRVFKKLIDIKGRDNTLIEGLSKTYKAIGNKRFKEKKYEDALTNFMLAHQTLDNPMFPIKSIDVQREILEKAIEKIKAKLNVKQHVRKTYILFLLFFSSTFCHFSSAFASDNSPLGARSSGIANASVSLADVWSVQNNQAGLGFVRDISAGVFYDNRFMLKELSMRAGAFAFPVKGGTFGLCVSNFGYSLYSESKYGLAFGKAFGDKFSAGIQMDYLTTKISEYGTKSVPAAEFGLQAKPLKNLIIGVHVFNLTKAKLVSYNDERIPTIMRLGFNYKFSEKVFLAGETEKDIDKKAIIKAGLEYRPIKEFYLRAGIATNPSLSCFGVGVVLKNFRLDFSTTYHSVFGLSPQIGLNYIFETIHNNATN